jgi:hypothetical protein
MSDQGSARAVETRSVALNREQFDFDGRAIRQRVVPFAVPACLGFAQAAVHLTT